MTNIREATADDIAHIVIMGQHFAWAHYHDIIPVNPDAMRATVLSLIGQPDRAVFIAETTPERPTDALIVGMLGLAAYDHPISGEHVVGEIFWWVEPEYRGSVGVRLLRRAERWAREHDAAVFNMIAPAGAENVEIIYQRLGYRCIEISYQKRFTKMGQEQTAW